jgi:hypothetical protein
MLTDITFCNITIFVNGRIFHTWHFYDSDKANVEDLCYYNVCVFPKKCLILNIHRLFRNLCVSINLASESLKEKQNFT